MHFMPGDEIYEKSYSDKKKKVDHSKKSVTSTTTNIVMIKESDAFRFFIMILSPDAWHWETFRNIF